ncbi:HD domain-containing phosphohydrolase [Holdemanella biformis]|nr:HD domain-containing phosphohydrolase [Holdemanella biformis]
MRTQKYNLQGIKVFFYILMIAILGWFCFMQLFGANEQEHDVQSHSIVYTQTFYWEKEDGSKQKINIPGKYEVKPGHTMVIHTTLPKDYNETSFAIRSSLQDVKFYVDNTLRKEYSTKDTRLAGKNSASRYIFCPTTYKDAGKTLRIELTTYTSNYSGVVNEIYCGSEIDIWQHIYSDYKMSTFIAFFILFAGITSVLFGSALKFTYHTNFSTEYLGWCMIMGAIWMLGESKIRQILVPNASSLASLCFVMIMLSPLPILFYADSIQNGKHRKLYKYIGYIALLNFVVSSILYLTKVKDYIETLPVAQCILICVFIMVFIHLYQYIHSTSKSRSDYFLLFGLFLVLICVAIEGISVYFVSMVSGLFTGIGMIILLLANIVRTIHKIHVVEQTRHQKELEIEKKENKKITLQMMQSLSTTIEAKDEYTRGHSRRVAQYAALIAKNLGWTDQEIENIKSCAYLHDIGKIGIPDQILNKPGQLTEDEFNLIKQHPIIGQDILKDITIIPHLGEVTRSHHEHYDGTGYPDGLKGNEIPIQARIITLADSYDAMNSKRIYRNALSFNQIKEEIEKNAGTQFDPKITNVFLKLMDDGSLFNLEHEIIPVQENTIDKFISDVVSTIKNQEETKNYDYLTGLPVRSVGQKYIAIAMQKTTGCLIFLDMDNLKKINDVYGHKAGDRALKSLGKLLLNIPLDKITCRMGGDEFLLFLPKVSIEETETIMSDLIEQFKGIVENDHEIHFATLSAGMLMTTKNDNFEDACSKADKALYYVKQNGKNNYSFYNQIQHKNTSNNTADLKQIAKSLHTSGSYTGALSLDFREFTRHYEYIHQLMVRNHSCCYLVMVTMETVEDTLPYIEKIEEALTNMGEAIHKNIRKVDVCTRYSAMQYLIILSQPTEAEIPNIMTRIFMQYYKLQDSQNFTPTYEYIAMKD